MSTETNGENAELEFAQAFKELARGERAASALEDHLDSLEKKIEELLAKAEDEQKIKTQSEPNTDAPSPPDTDSKGTL
ncbi:hypothetical protein B0J11DRAFT_577041 [Dendryphion nanum]|uniref:Uncharacterized protein n=1 Tax=Dendryphion nanum TaxID=256645 RepID=A0A9P9IV18_9PLEO|nr:hypothetical protein B0J11DRAFT_577041 [Dendryphion nanum]